MIHTFVLLILLCFISHKVTASQEWPTLSQELLPAKMAARQKWLSFYSICQPNVCASQMWLPWKKSFPAKSSCQTKVATSQESMPALKKKPEQNGCQPKLAARKNVQHEKRGCKPKAAASQMPVQAKTGCQRKVAVGWKWPPVKNICQCIVLEAFQLKSYFFKHPTKYNTWNRDICVTPSYFEFI